MNLIISADLLTIIGFIATILGLLFTAWQVWLAKNAAEVAKNASLETKVLLTRNITLIELSNCLKLLAEIRNHLQNDKYESVLLRAEDFRAVFIQMREIQEFENFSVKEFKSTVQQFSVLSKTVRKQIYEPKPDFDKETMLSKLSGIENKLNESLGKTKLSIRGEKND